LERMEKTEGRGEADGNKKGSVAAADRGDGGAGCGGAGGVLDSLLRRRGTEGGDDRRGFSRADGPSSTDVPRSGE